MPKEDVVDKVVQRKEIKLKYPILKKEGYVLDYGSIEKGYVDVYLVKELDDATNMTIHISEKRITKRIDYDDVKPLTWNEIKGINEILSQIG